MSKAYSNDLREQVIKNYEEGMPKEKLVEVFKIGISTLNRWIRTYLKTGSIEARKRNKQEREEFVKKLEEEKASPIVFVDESGIKNEYGRSPRGVKIVEDKKGRATEKVNLIAGLLEDEIIAPFVYDCNTNAEVFNVSLEQCLIPVLPPNCIIVLDHARFHKSAKTVEIIEKNGHRLVFLPPYSPDLNPIEKCWAVIKRKLKNLLMQCDSIYSSVELVFQTK